MKLFIILLLALSSLHADTLVYDPTVYAAIGEQLKQGYKQLQQLQQQLQTAQNLYNTAQSALKYQGNPANVVGGIKDAALGGNLTPSTIGSTFNNLMGSLNQLSSAPISPQLQSLLGAPSVSVDSIKNQLLAGQTPTNNLAKYQAMEQLFGQQQQQIQTASAQSNNLRAQLIDLRSQVATAPDQATVDKLNAAITSTSAALATTDSTIASLNEQTQVSAQMVKNRKMMEDAAYQEAYKEVSDQQAQDDAIRTKNAISNLNNTR